MFKHVTAIAVVGCICAATVAPAMAFTPPHLPVGGGIRVVVTPRPGRPGPDPATHMDRYTQPMRTWTAPPPPPPPDHTGWQ
jgi:hypothetical protein